jgi:hypothetical protein
MIDYQEDLADILKEIAEIEKEEEKKEFGGHEGVVSQFHRLLAFQGCEEGK